MEGHGLGGQEGTGSQDLAAGFERITGVDVEA
jgi:hypothetical protein